MIRVSFYLLFLLSCAGIATAQSFNRDPGNPNLDFSAGDFSNWRLGWGPRTDPDSAAGPQPGASSHTITPIYGTNWDGSAGTGKLARVPSGVSAVARFGAPAGGGYGSPRAYSMSYPIKVDARYPVLFLQLASVMDKTHYNDYNTHYRFRLSNSAGTDIPSQPCTGLELYPMGTGSTAGTNVATLPDIGLKLLPEAGAIAYQPWQSIAINLAAYAGQTLTLTLEHFDCWTGFHGSYDYLTAGMQPLTDTFYFCEADSMALLSPYIPRFRSYRWSTGDTSEQLLVRKPADGTLYTCNAGSYNGCNTVFNYRLLAIKTSPGFNTTPGSICRELNFHDLSVTSKGVITEWHWQFGDTVSGTADTSSLQHPVHTFSTPGVYSIHVRVVTSEGCSTAMERTISVQEAALFTGFTLAPAGYCRGYSFADTSTTTKGSIDRWHWDFGDPASGNKDTAGIPFPEHRFSSPGSYTIQLHIGSSIGCAGSFSTTLSVPDIQAPTFSLYNSCLGEAVLAYTGDPRPLQQYWRLDDSSGVTDADTLRHIYADAGDYTLLLYFTDAYHCSDSIARTLSVYPLPEVTFQAVPARAPVTNPELVFTAAPGDAARYHWDWGDGAHTDTATATVLHRYAALIQDYEVVLAVTDPHGCRDTAHMQVTVSADQVFIPSAFSPNADGRNDVFGLINLTEQRLEDFSIYNRYGQCVFQTKDPGRDWDGRMNGTELEIGTYYYHVSLIYPDGHKELLKGDLSLIR